MDTELSDTADYEENLNAILDGIENAQNSALKKQNANELVFLKSSSNNARRKLEEYLDNRNLEKIVNDGFEYFDQ